jgi:hypothetical protein
MSRKMNIMKEKKARKDAFSSFAKRAVNPPKTPTTVNMWW